jgi:hypothetical protein
MSRETIEAIREKARVLFEGKDVPHRNCGAALAEAFDRDPRPYQALRRGGVTGENECGAIVAGRLLLGEILGYPDPTAPTSLALRDAIQRYRVEVAKRVHKGGAGTMICDDLVKRFPIYHADERVAFCAGIIATIAEIVAEIVFALGGTLEVTPIRDR